MASIRTEINARCQRLCSASFLKLVKATARFRNLASAFPGVSTAAAATAKGIDVGRMKNGKLFTLYAFID